MDPTLWPAARTFREREQEHQRCCRPLKHWDTIVQGGLLGWLRCRGGILRRGRRCPLLAAARGVGCAAPPVKLLCWRGRLREGGRCDGGGGGHRGGGPLARARLRGPE